MNVQADATNTPEPELALESDGVRRHIWRVLGAQILIEVFDDGTAAVNGERVEQAPSTPTPAAPSPDHPR